MVSDDVEVCQKGCAKWLIIVETVNGMQNLEVYVVMGLDSNVQKIIKSIAECNIGDAGKWSVLALEADTTKSQMML